MESSVTLPSLKAQLPLDTLKADIPLDALATSNDPTSAQFYVGGFGPVATPYLRRGGKHLADLDSSEGRHG